MINNKYLRDAKKLIADKWDRFPYSWTVTLIAIKSILTDLHKNKEYSQLLPVWTQPLSSNDYDTLTEYEQDTLNSENATRYAGLSARLRKRRLNEIYTGLKKVKKLAELTNDTATVARIGTRKTPGIIKDLDEIIETTNYGRNIGETYCWNGLIIR